VKRFRGGLVFKAHRLVYHSTLGLTVIKKKKKVTRSANAHGTSTSGRKSPLRVYGLWFRVWGLGFRVEGLGFRVLGLGFEV